MKHQLHLVPGVNQSLLDFLQSVRLLADVDQVPKADRPPLQHPDGALPAGHSIRPQALGFRMNAVAVNDLPILPIGLHPGQSVVRWRHTCRDPKRIARVHIGPADLGPLPGVPGVRFQLFAPYEADPRRWLRLPWVDRYSGERYRISTTAETGGVGVARVQTYRDVLEDFLYHPEAKSSGLDGRTCTRQTVGLLGRRVVRSIPELTAHVGKESNRLEEVEAGVEHDPDEIWTE